MEGPSAGSRSSRSTDQFTVGAHTAIDVSGVGLMLEGYLQRGERRPYRGRHQFALGAAVRSVGRVRSQLAWEWYAGDREGEGRAVHWTRYGDQATGSTSTIAVLALCTAAA